MVDWLIIEGLVLFGVTVSLFILQTLKAFRTFHDRKKLSKAILIQIVILLISSAFLIFSIFVQNCIFLVGAYNDDRSLNAEAYSWTSGLCSFSYCLHILTVTLCVCSILFRRGLSGAISRSNTEVNGSATTFQDVLISQLNSTPAGPWNNDQTRKSPAVAGSHSQSQLYVVYRCGFYILLVIVFGALLLMTLSLSKDFSEGQDSKLLTMGHVNFDDFFQTWYGHWFAVFVMMGVAFLVLIWLNEFPQHSLNFRVVVVFCCLLILFDVLKVPLYIYYYVGLLKITSMVQTGVVVFMANYVLLEVLKTSLSSFEVIFLLFLNSDYLLLKVLY